MEPRDIAGIVLLTLVIGLLVGYVIRALRSGYVHFGMRWHRVYRHQDPGTFWITVIFGGVVVPVATISGVIWELGR